MAEGRTMTLKTAFITGSSRGIGKAIAEQLAAQGYHLVLNGREEERLYRTAEALSEAYHVTCLPFAGDIGDAGFVEKTFSEIEKKLGGLDVLVNNAGISYIGLLNDMTLDAWNRIIQTNLTSVFLCCRYAVPMMLKKKRGKIINISSVWGNTGASCEVAYSAAKGGMNAFTRALGKELAPSNIQVNAIACGTIDTEMNGCFSPEERKALENEIPCGRYGSPGEVAKMAVSLIDAPSYFTGQIVTMDGGWT